MVAQHRIFYGYRIIAAAFVSQFVALGIFSYVLGPFMLPMIEDLGWSRTEYTLSRSIGQMVMGITGFLIGSYIDRFGPRPLMLIGAVFQFFDAFGILADGALRGAGDTL